MMSNRSHAQPAGNTRDESFWTGILDAMCLTQCILSEMIADLFLAKLVHVITLSEAAAGILYSEAIAPIKWTVSCRCLSTGVPTR